MFTAANKLNGGWEMKEDATGQVMFVPDQQADQMFSQGTAKRSGGGGGGMSEAPNSLGAFSQDFGAPGRAALPAESPRPLGRNQALAPPGGIKGVNSMQAPVRQSSAPSTPTKRSGYRVPPPDQQAAGPDKPNYDSMVQLVKYGGRDPGMVPHSSSTSGITTTQQNDLESLELLRRQRMLEAVTEEAEARRQQANAVSWESQRTAMQARQEIDEKTVIDEEKKKYAQQQISRMRKDVDDVQKGHISTWHEDGGVGRTLLSAIAMAGGAFASGINGGPNMAMQIIDRAIERDVEAKLNDKEGRLTAAQQRLLDTSNDLGLSAAERKQYLIALEKKEAAAKFAQYQADQELQQWHPQLQQGMAYQEGESNKILAEIYKARENNAMLRYDPGSSGGYSVQLTPEGKLAQARSDYGAHMAGNEGKVAEAQGKMNESSDGSIRKGDIMGRDGTKLGHIADETVARDVQHTISAYDDIEDTGQKLLAIYKDGSVIADEGEREALKNALIGYLKKVGENSDSDAIRHAERVGSTDWIRDKGYKALETTLNVKRGERDSVVSRYRLKGGAERGKALRSKGGEYD